MAHIYMQFDFADEENAQQARHKLDVWKQTFRLDKKLQYKLERAEDADEQNGPHTGEAVGSAKDSEKPKSTVKSRPGKKTARAASGGSESNGAGKVLLLIRLYFSNHEKLSEQRWLDRIPTEEPFKSASRKVLRQGEAGFQEVLKQFSELD